MSMHRHVGGLLLAGILSLPAGVAAQGGTGDRVQDRFWDAAMSGDTVALTQALAAGAVVDSLDTRGNPNGRHALNWSAWYGHVAAMRILLARGAALDSRNLTWNTPLHHAAEAGSADAVRFLLAAGADPTITNFNGNRPAESARRNGHLEVAVLLDSAVAARAARVP
jgi:ankyrin repeat protein